MGVLVLIRPGAGLAVKRGGAAVGRWLVETLRELGVGARVGAFRSGDSGRARDGRDFGLN